jgi:hypothetical protein
LWSFDYEKNVCVRARCPCRKYTNAIESTELKKSLRFENRPMHEASAATIGKQLEIKRKNRKPSEMAASGSPARKDEKMRKTQNLKNHKA